MSLVISGKNFTLTIGGAEPEPSSATQGAKTAPSKAAESTAVDAYDGATGSSTGAAATAGATGSSSSRTLTTALSEAKALLGGATTATETKQGAVITHNALDVNSADDTDEKSARHLAAESQVKANASLEQKKLDKLTAGQRTQYKAIKSKLSDDPVAQLALQSLLLSGKLTAKKALSGNDTALTGLAKLSSQELAEGIDRKQLLGDLVQELACPEAINQRDRGTCAATTAAIHLARSNPAEYVRLLSGLAGKSGSVKTASGTVARREAGTAAEDGTNRSVSQRLLAPAMMEIANGLLDYSNKDDKHFSVLGNEKGSGLSAAQVDKLLEAIYGKQFAYAQNIDKATDRERAAAYELIKDELRQGETVPVGLIWNEVTSGEGGTVTHTGHKVLVTGTTSRDGQEFVSYINPWGRTEQMPKEEFLSRLRNVNYTPR